MKYLFTALLFISLTANAQKDSVATDSTALISARDLQPLFDELKKLPYETAAPFINYLLKLVAIREQEYNKRKTLR